MLLKEVADAIQLRKELEVKEKALKDALLLELKKANKESDESEVGKVTIARRSYYTYSEMVTKLEEEVKIKKVEEVEKGIAKEEVTEYLLFKEAKIK